MARKKPPAQSAPPAIDKQVLLTLTVLAGLAVYLLLFYAAGLPSLGDWGDGLISRGEFLFVVLFRFDEVLGSWFGRPGDLLLLDRLPVLAIAGVILAWAASLGWLLMTLSGADRGLTRLEVLFFSTAVGLNIVSTYVLLVGLLGLLGNRAVFAVPAALTLAAAASIWLRRKAETRRGACAGVKRTHGSQSLGAHSARPQPPACEQPPTCPREDAEGDGGLSPRWLWLAAPFVVVIMLGGMLPPIDFDVREYHLQVPKEFFQQGSVGFLPHNVYGNMPMGTEMLSLLAMVLSGDWWLGALAGKTVIAAFAPLTALGLFAAGRRFFSSSAGVVAAILYISIPWIVRVSCLGLVEGASACYLFLALYAALLPDTKGQAPSLLAGYLAGGAVACKYPAVLFVLLPLAVGIVLGRRKELAAAWKPLGVFLLAAVLGCGLWFGKNWALAGNPTYPLLYGVFNGKTWTPEKDQQWNNVHRPHDFSPQALAKDMARVGLRSEWLSPLVMPLAALAFMVQARRRLSLVLLAYFGYVILAWWLLTHRIDRFWIPVLPLVALLAGAGACWSRDLIWRRALVGLLLFGAVSGLLVTTSGPGGYNRYFMGLKRLRADPTRLDPWHRYFNTHPPDGRVLVVGDAQVFDLEVPVFYSTCFDDSLFEQLVKDPATGGVRPADEIRASLHARDISHVYVHWGEIGRYREPGNYGFTDFVHPAVFERLVAEGVLEPLAPIEGHAGRAYRVVSD